MRLTSLSLFISSPSFSLWLQDTCHLMPFTKYSLLDQSYFFTSCLSIAHIKFTNKIHQLFTDYLLRLPYSELLETHLFRSRANRRLVLCLSEGIFPWKSHSNPPQLLPPTLWAKCRWQMPSPRIPGHFRTLKWRYQVLRWAMVTIPSHRWCIIIVLPTLYGLYIYIIYIYCICIYIYIYMDHKRLLTFSYYIYIYIYVQYMGHGVS